ncbi:hypothetical protein [Desertimonas flava]|uniref:hypothetical protein n=1 Tax=Desertimonas flava TaxID=2064846 RepID=UPI000E356F22|nr:hypothetical protein [Desertimonas flava]
MHGLRTARARWRGAIELIGLVAVVVAFIGMASIHAFQQPPFAPPDETAHLGYAHEIADFRLPEIDRAPDIPDSAVQWAAERSTARDERYLGVWVANHPPLNYVVTAPLIWLSDATDRADGGLLYMRLANVAMAAVGVVLTFALAGELAGGSRRVGLLAAAVVAAVPQGHGVFSQGLNDGMAFAVGTSVIWAGVRCLTRGAARRDVVLLAATSVVASGTRAATMLLAIAVVGCVGAWQLARGPSPVRERAVSALTVWLGAAIPMALAFGWFYLRNIHLYGDIGASDYLLRRFRRTRKGSVLSMMTRGHMWANLYQRLTTPATLGRRVPPGLTISAILMTAGVVGAAATGRPGGGATGDDPEERTTFRAALGLCTIAVVVIAATVAQHVSGGGNAYPRYLFPVLGVLAALAVVGLDRLVPYVAPLALAVALGWWAILNLPVDVDPTRIRRPRDDGAPPVILQVLPVGDGWRVAAGVLVAIGAIVAAVAMLASTIGDARSRRATTTEATAMSPV